MARLSRKLRVCKWVGTVGCVLIVGAFVFSGWSWVFICWETREKTFHVDLAYGVTALTCELKLPVDYPGFKLFPLQDRSELWASVIETPRLESSSGPGADPGFRAVLPLWLPFVGLLLPTLLLWRRDRRKPRPGFCPHCDYDLTGNTTGRCPECSTPCEPAADEATPRAG